MTDEKAIEDRIRARAHEIWEREGRPGGAELRHWDEARLEIEAEERVSAAQDEDAPGDGQSGEAMIGGPSPEPDLPPEAGQGAATESSPAETEASPSQLERAPI